MAGWSDSVVELQQKPQEEVKDEFVFEEAKDENKNVYVIYGEKGDGKTTSSFMFPGKIACISFDRKSVIIKNNYYEKEERIKVFDALKYWDESPHKYTESSDKTYKYVLFLIEQITEQIKPDYIIIDGLEILERIAEMSMRFNNKLGYTQGIANYSVWKERRLKLRTVHRKIFDACNKGVIYTTYTKEKKIVEDGSLITQTDIPKWIDVILWQSDCVLRAYSKLEEQNKRDFYIRVDSSKLNNFKTGQILKLTGKKDIFKEL